MRVEPVRGCQGRDGSSAISVVLATISPSIVHNLITDGGASELPWAIAGVCRPERIPDQADGETWKR